MRLSFTTMATPELDHRGAIELALKYGFDGVDIRCSESRGEVLPDASDAELDGVALDFRRARIALPSVLCYNSTNPDKPNVWDLFSSELRNLLKVGARLGAESIRIFGIRPKDPAQHDAYFSHCAEGIRDALADDSSSVGIIIQNHQSTYGALDAAALAERVAHPRFGMVFSPDHLTLRPEGDFEEVLKRVRPWTREVYIADRSAGKESHDCLPGAGVVPLRRTVEFFEASGFEGFYSLKWEKIWNPSLAPADVALPHFIEFMKSL